MNKVWILAVSLFLITGCSTINKSALTAPVNISATSNLHAEVEVGEKVTGSSKARFFLGFFQISGPNKFADGVFGGGFESPLDPTPGLKAAAAYNALEESQADVIVNPQYVVKVNRRLIFTAVEVTVTGYKGTVTGITSVKD